MRILIVKLSSLGDVVQTMPVVHDMRQALPHAQIDWVVEEAFAPLVQQVQGVQRVLPIAQRRWRKSWLAAPTRHERATFAKLLQAQSYDAVIDFQGLIKSALVARSARLAPGGFRATYANASEACAYEWPVRLLLDRLVPMPRRIHAVARYRLLAAQVLGYPVDGPSSYPLAPLASGAVAVERYGVLLAHGTTRADNEWPERDWIAVGEQLIAQGHTVELPQAGALELARVQRIAQALGPQARVWPALSLVQVTQRMAASGGVIGVDSGLSHLAVALDLPHVQIFSQARAWRAGPVGNAHQVAVGGKAAPSVSAVWAAWQAVGAAYPCRQAPSHPQQVRA
ncbi:MAG: lipopolysaccharide heptosyltransferase I [Betaproteobacteria bacterium]